jgi:hypothetical protein
MMTNEGTWRVPCENGDVHTIDVRRLGEAEARMCTPFVWSAGCEEVGGSAGGRTAREAVQSIVRMAFWTPLEILAPGEVTRAEAVARAVAAEREACALLAAYDEERHDGLQKPDIHDEIGEAIRARGTP